MALLLAEYFDLNYFTLLHKDQAIGIFDSGIGGLTVANAVLKHLPKERIIYFGDTVHLPYGDKSADAIRYYCLKIAKFLVEQNCKLIVVACNSASSVGYKVLLEFFNQEVLFVNVVDPLVERIVKEKPKKVGIFATKATIQSEVYQRKINEFAANVEVAALATPLLAPMIEEGFVHNRISEAVLETYLSHPGFKNMDTLLLACTHYPLIRKAIESYFNHQVNIYDSADLVAYHVQALLSSHSLLNNDEKPIHQFFLSDYTSSFEETARMFFGNKLGLKQHNIW